MRLNYSLFSLVVLGTVACVIPAMATSVTGTASIENPGGAGTEGVTVNLGGVFFNATGSGDATTQNPFAPGGIATGSFTGLTGGFIKNLVGAPTTGAHSITDFAEFNVSGATPVIFDLTDIAAGIGSAGACTSSMVGSICTPPGSPFTLSQIAPNAVSISLVLNGIAYTGTSASGSSGTVGSFTTQDTMIGTIPGILAAVATDGGVHESYSASFTATPSSIVPEPATLLLMGIGLLGAGLVARRKITK